jgi:hypothetical protein
MNLKTPSLNTKHSIENPPDLFFVGDPSGGLAGEGEISSTVRASSPGF